MNMLTRFVIIFAGFFFCNAALAQKTTIGDFVWNDLNGDGLQSADEPGIADATIELWRVVAGFSPYFVSFSKTDNDGRYLINPPGAGTYFLVFKSPSYYYPVLTSPSLPNELNSDILTTDGKTAPFSIAANAANLTIDAGFRTCTMAVKDIFSNPQCGASNSDVMLEVTGGQAPYNYDWADLTGSSDPATRLNLSSGLTYRYTVQDAAGCRIEKNLTIGGFKLEAYAENPVCASANYGKLITSVLGGTPPYKYDWSDIVEPDEGPIRENVSPGTYKVVVTDATGCSKTASLGVKSASLILITPSIKKVVCGVSLGAINLTITGGSSPYTYDWSNETDGIPHNGTKNPSNLSQGIYTVTVTDAAGCSATRQMTVGPLSTVKGQTTPTGCPGTSQGKIALTYGSGTFRFDWADVAGNDNPPNRSELPAGLYTLTIDENGCTYVQTFEVKAVISEDCAFVAGKVVADRDNNCALSAGDRPAAGVLIRAMADNSALYGYTDSLGAYRIALAPGTYAIQVADADSLIKVCAPPLPVVIAQPTDRVQRDLLVRGLPECPLMEVDITTPRLRRCFSANKYWVRYCNKGLVGAADVYIDVVLDSLLIFEQASRPFTTLNNRTLRFPIGWVEAGQCGVFSLDVTVDCQAPLGRTHCTSAVIFPDSICKPDYSLWSGAHLSLEAVCAGDSIRFLLKNNGQGDMNQPLEYIVIEDGVMRQKNQSDPLSAGEAIVVSVPANGATWRLEAIQEAYAPPGYVNPSLSIEGCGGSGSYSTGYVDQFPNERGSPGYSSDCTANIGAYDPNDKRGFPIGFGAQRFILPDTEIEYMIRFQNTGTDTAFNVVVRDTLSPLLQIAAVRPGAASAPYRFDISGPRVLSFYFDGISLPDSNANQAGSNGFVTFRVTPESKFQPGSVIENKAAIFFDSNDPIITNTTVHRIRENFLTVALWEATAPQYHATVSPNPTTGAATLTLNGAPAYGNYLLRLTDARGAVSRIFRADTPHFVLADGDLPPGMYFFNIALNGQTAGVGKLAVVGSGRL